MERNNTIPEKNRETKFLKYTLIIVIFLLIIFFATRDLWFIEHKEKDIGSCADIFNITFGPDCDCDEPSRNPSHDEEEPTDSEKDDENKDNDNDNDYDNNDNNEYEPPYNVEVFDEETHYSIETPLDIFSKSTSHVVNGKIAPGLTNTYEFIVRNNNSYAINYELKMTEKNKDNINMKYRLKLNGKYVIGSKDKWVTYKDLVLQTKTLQAYKQDKYTLEWKWIEASNDTQIGTDLKAKYELKLKKRRLLNLGRAT